MKEEKKKVGLFTRAKNYSVKQATYISGWDSIKKGHQTLSPMIEDIKASVGVAKGSVKVNKENFEQAKERLNVSDLEIEKVRNNYVLVSWIFWLLTITSFGTSIYSLFGYHSILGALVPLVMAIYGATGILKYSFRAYQIKARKLCSLKEFISVGEFFPRMNKTIKNK